jgi:hypothetical protein
VLIEEEEFAGVLIDVVVKVEFLKEHFQEFPISFPNYLFLVRW